VTDGNSGNGEKLVAALASLLSAMPPAYQALATLFEFGRLPSIYQPGIYRDVPTFFLLIPIAIGLYAGWRATTHSTAIPKIFAVVLSLTIVVGGVFFALPSDHLAHKANWIISQIVVSLLCAFVFGIGWSLLKPKS
jgi:hypothetical protein